MSAVGRTSIGSGAYAAPIHADLRRQGDQRPPAVTDGHGPGGCCVSGAARAAQVKMSRGRNAETTKLGTSTTSLTLRSTATLQIA
jgi:hypothetical protein